MAVPASFDESNDFLSAPPGHEDEVLPLSIWRGVVGKKISEDVIEGPIQVISCWKLTAEELEEVNRTGRIWLGIYGPTMAPAWISGHKPFTQENLLDSDLDQ